MKTIKKKKVSPKLKFVATPINEKNERYFGCASRVCAIGTNGC